jgi:hypothetical protein
VVRPDRLDTRGVLAAVVLLTLYPFVVAATHDSFWRHRDMAPVVPAVAAALVVALVLRRRWAWGLLLLLQGIATIRSIATGDAIAAVTCSLATALLTSAALRHYVGVGPDGAASP